MRIRLEQVNTALSALIILDNVLQVPKTRTKRQTPDMWHILCTVRLTLQHPVQNSIDSRNSFRCRLEVICFVESCIVLKYKVETTKFTKAKRFSFEEIKRYKCSEFSTLHEKKLCMLFIIDKIPKEYACAPNLFVEQIVQRCNCKICNVFKCLLR